MAYLRAAIRCSTKCGNNTIQFTKLPAVSSLGSISLKSTHAASAVYESDRSAAADGPRKDPLDITFQDPHAAFKSKTTWEVLRAYIVYTLCSSEYLVENNMKLMKLTKAVFGDRMFKFIMKSTFYGHFVAGEDSNEIRPVLERLLTFGVKPILDYSVEEDLSQEEAEKREVEGSTSLAAEPGDDKLEGGWAELSKSIERVQGRSGDLRGHCMKASVTGARTDIGQFAFLRRTSTMPQYHVDKSFADRRYKVASARTYFYLNEAQCERNMETFQHCLEAVSGTTFGMGICAVKLTALGRPQLLLQLSEVIMRTRQYMADVAGGAGNVLSHHVQAQDLKNKIERSVSLMEAPVKDFLEKITYDQEGVIHLFPWSGIIDENQQLNDTFRVPDLKTGRMVRLISQLTPKEEEMFRNMIRRLNTLTKTAKDLDVRIMIDAEQTYFQPAISRITLEMMRKYNKDRAIIFNTYQCYLKDTYKECTTDLEQAKRQNFFFGAKLVRGAYLEQERARAAAMGYTDPTNPNFEATSEMYHRTLTECLRRIKDLKDKGDDKKIAIMVASHNEDTVRFALEKMSEIGISPEDKVICFGQLLGMCDYITFPLGQSGYSAYKYIPYGPINEVLPYLSRRAQENKGILKKIKKEKKLLLTELGRRIARGQLFHKPHGNYRPV